MADADANRVRAAIYGAFDRWGQRSIEKLFQEIRKGGRIAKEAYRGKWLEEAFLEKRAKDPGLMRHVLQQTVKSKVLAKHKQVLLRSALVSVAAKESPVVKEFAEKSRKRSGRQDMRRSEDSYNPRSLYRLRKDGYPEVFFDQGPSRRDRRSERISTIFGTSPLPRNGATDDAAAYLAADRAKVWADPRNRAIVAHHVSIRDVLPECIEAFRVFRKDFNLAIGELLEDPNISKETLTLLHREAEKNPELVHVLFNHVSSVLAVKWFRGRPEREKEVLVEQDFPLDYTKQDARKAYELLSADLNGPTALFALTNLASAAMYALHYAIDGIHLWQAVLELRPNDPATQAAAWDNIGIFWRQLGDPMMTIEAMNNAIPLYRQVGDKIQELIAERNVGEALVRANRIEEGLTQFRVVETRIGELTTSAERCHLWINLAEGARRCGQAQMECDYLMHLIGESPETEVLIHAENRLLQLNLRGLTSHSA